MDGAPRPIARVNSDSNTANGHVEMNEWQIFTAFQTSKIIDKCVDWFAGVLYTPESSTRLAPNVLGYELLRQIINLPNNSTACLIFTVITRNNKIFTYKQ